MNTAAEKTIRYGSEKQTGDDGQTVWAWWFVTLDDVNNEPIAGGYCATEADALTDASIWMKLNPEYALEASK